ncbi:hypothetical protein PINS_up015394 [Pythium insidiosum]|nr:hypothetical protein PINS_up015394 [Pythium insidiosum]
MDGERMQAFLERVLPLVEQALQQNETLDVFLDPFAHLFEEDATLANKNENAIKELRSFTDLIYSKNKTLPAIDWHPKKNGVVAVAAAANVTFSKRLDLLDKIDSSYILIWNFVDLIHPQLMLEAPQDVLTLRFNPTQPHIVAAGLYNGQILVWDFSKAEQHLSKAKAKAATTAKSSGGSVNANAADDEPPKQIPPVKPLYVSYIDSSHRRPVADLLWLPSGMEVNNRGHLVAASDPLVHQFVTIAGDGQVSFWDLRFKDPKYRGITRAKLDKGAPKDAVPEVHFIPIYSIALTKLDSAGELSLRCFCLERPREDTAAATSASLLSSRFFCATEEGELVYADWRPHAAATAGGAAGKQASSSSASHGHDDGGDDGGVEYVQWLCRDHFRSTIAVCVSPFFPSIVMTVSESSFHLWNVSQVSKSAETNDPIFSSPLSPAALTCGAFSPTRPAVIYVGKADGMLEVWDFMDQSHRASLTVGVTACALTSIEFRPNVSAGGAATGANAASAGAASKLGAAKPAAGAGTGAGGAGPAAGGTTNATSLGVKQQLVAIGDQIGNLHIMEIPRTLARASGGERQAMEAYFKRESERMKATRDGAPAMQQHHQGSNNSGGGARGEAGTTLVPPKTAAPPSVATTNPVEDELFKQMENEFCRELGIDLQNVAAGS